MQTKQSNSSNPVDPKRVLVTGAAGFVGANLTRRLIAEGHEVHALLKPTTATWRLGDAQPALHVHHADLTDEAILRAIVAAVRPQVIYHLAAHGGYSSQMDADQIIHTNFLGTWNLLKAAATVGYELFVNTGSSSEYGFKDEPMRETDRLDPNSFYAVAKCAQTLLCQYVARSEMRPIVTVRLFSVYGPLEEPTRLVPTLIRRCLDGQDLILVAPDTARDFVYVDDVVDAYLRVDRLTKCSGEIINIGTGVQSSIRQVVYLLLGHTGAKVQCHWGAMPARIWDAKTWVADCRKSAALLGWQPRTTLSAGLARTVTWVRHAS